MASTEEQPLNQLQTMLDTARNQLRAQSTPSTGAEACRAYADAMTELLAHHCAQLVESASFPNELAKRYALVAVGGFGRGELCLFSDVDLVFLTRDEPNQTDEEFFKAFLYPLWNLKIELGYSVKSLPQLLGEIGEDLDLATSVMGARHVWGNESIHADLQREFRVRVMLNHEQELTTRLLDGVTQRHRKFSNTSLLLEPNIKEAPGGIRDVNVMTWLACLHYGEPTFAALVGRGIVSSGEARSLAVSHSFLLNLRNVLHALDGRKNDVLNFERQIKVAALFPLENHREHLLPEERLMRDYYDHTGVVDRVGRRTFRKFAEHQLDSSPQGRATLRAKRIEGLYWMRGTTIWIDPRDAAKLPRDGMWIMQFFAVAAQYDLSPTEQCLDLVEQHLATIDDTFRRSPINRDRFLSVLRRPLVAARMIRVMHRCGFLDAYLPEMTMVRNMPRIDYYHQFTVDEHLLRSVECAGELFDETSPFSRTHVASIARQLLRLDLLCLALLLHDIGKGEGRGHVIRGAHIVQRISERIGLSRIEAHVLHQLVLNHQKMSTLALKRNPEDPAVPRELARDVGESDMLRKLYVLTCCDLRAVSGESWNDWRGYLLGTLFERTMEHLIPREERGNNNSPEGAELAAQVIAEIREEYPDHMVDAEASTAQREVESLLEDLPDRYRASTPVPVIARHMRMARELDDENVVRWELEPFEEANYSFLHSVVRDAPGLFCNLCGALASRGFNILSAQIYTARNGMCIDIFQIQDIDNQPPKDEESLVRLREKLNDVLRGKRAVDWASQMPRKAQPVSTARLDLRPPSVTISNEESGDGYTSIEVKAPDRPGLLFDITSVLDRHRIHIHVALVATESYQVVDVFYVTDWDNNRLTPGNFTKKLHGELLQAVAPSQTINSVAAGKSAAKGKEK